MSAYDVFLSHSGAEEPEVEYLARKLREAGIFPFFDKWHLIPGMPWQEALEDALEQSRTCAVLLGRDLGPWQNEEMRSALEKRLQDPSFRVIPVLLPGLRRRRNAELPPFLRRLMWVEFHAGPDDPEAFQRLLAGIRGEAPGPGGAEGPPSVFRCMAPPREPFVQRGEYRQVVEALCSGGAPGPGTTVAITTAIHGAGGFGKTALALELCYDARVRRHFRDGILWMSQGENLDEGGRLVRVMDLIRWWTEEDPPSFKTLEAAGSHLRRILEGRRVLLILDDVWHLADVPPYQGLGSGSALLITTRDRRMLPSQTFAVEVDAMETSAAVRLLGSDVADGATAELADLAARLGEWPLLLKIVNRQLRELVHTDELSLSQALREVGEALDAAGLTVFDREDLESRNQAVARTLGASLRRLSPEDVERFEELAIFPQDRDIPVSVLARFWGVGIVAAKMLCAHLHDLSLLLHFDRRSGTIRLHDVIRAYLLRKHGSGIARLHQRLLDLYRPTGGRWSDLPPEESFLWRHLAHHLTGCGDVGTLRDLLLDFDFLHAKLEATEIKVLLRDYSSLPEGDDEARVVQSALRLSAHVLAKDPRQLAGQLLGRLSDRRSLSLQKLLQRARFRSRGLWLCPRTASLTRPGGSLIRTLEGHSRGVTAVAILYHRRVLSASLDKTLRIWDLESGSSLLTLEGHTAAVNALARLDLHRALSASSDKTLRLWDLTDGKTLRIFAGHANGVTGVAIVDDRRVVSASSDDTLRVWDLEIGETLEILRGHTRGVNAVVSLDTRHVVSASADGTLRVWDVRRGETKRILAGHTHSVLALALLDRGRVVSASDDGTLRVWDTETGQTLQVLEGHTSGVSAVAGLDRWHVVSASVDGALRLWDLKTGQTVHALKAHPQGVLGVTVLDDRRVLSASMDETLCLWDLVGSTPRPSLEEHSGAVQALAFLDERRLVSASLDGSLRVWDFEKGASLGAPLEGRTGAIHGVAALDATRVISVSADPALHLWDLESRKLLATLTGHKDRVRAVAVLDGRRVVSASADGTMRVWDLTTGETVSRLEGHSGSVNQIAVLDGERIVSASSDGTLRVWDLVRRQCLQVIERAGGGKGGLAVLDGERAVSSAPDGALVLCDLAVGRIAQRLSHPGKAHLLAALNPRRLVTTLSDRTLRIWDLETGEILCTSFLDASATAIAVAPGGRLLVTGDSMGRVHFFDLMEPAPAAW